MPWRRVKGGGETGENPCKNLAPLTSLQLLKSQEEVIFVPHTSSQKRNHPLIGRH